MCVKCHIGAVATVCAAAIADGAWRGAVAPQVLTNQDVPGWLEECTFVKLRVCRGQSCEDKYLLLTFWDPTLSQSLICPNCGVEGKGSLSPLMLNMENI